MVARSRAGFPWPLRRVSTIKVRCVSCASAVTANSSRRKTRCWPKYLHGFSAVSRPGRLLAGPRRGSNSSFTCRNQDCAGAFRTRAARVFADACAGAVVASGRTAADTRFGGRQERQCGLPLAAERGEVCVHPGGVHLRLWSDSAEQFHAQASSLPRVSPDDAESGSSRFGRTAESGPESGQSRFGTATPTRC